MSLAEAVAELEEQLEQALRDRDDARSERDELATELHILQFAENDELESVLEVIADHKRGLIGLEELYERTVGR